MSTTPDTTPITPTTPPDPVPVPPVTELGLFIEALQREVSLPGQFASDYPDISEDALLGALADAFSEAQLDGWFGTFTLDLDAYTISPPITPAAGALIVIYAGMRWVRTEIRGVKTSVRYKAGPVEYESQQGVGPLVQLLKDLTARKDALIANAAAGARIDYMLDSYAARTAIERLGLFSPLEMPGQLMGIGPGTAVGR